MNKLIKLSFLTLVSVSVAFGAESNPPEWLPQGESIDVYEYNQNNPHSPATFSSVNSKGLNEN